MRRVRHYIRYRNKVLSDIQYLTLLFVNSCSAVVRHQIDVVTVGRSQCNIIIILIGSFGNDLSMLDIGISDIDLVQYRNGS